MIEWTVQSFREVESTQDLIHEVAAQGHAEGVVVQSMVQLGGKGRRGNKWVSPVGNLYMSLLLRPECSVQEAGQISFVIAVAASDMLDDHIDPDKHTKTLKWPNDILIDGLKLSGILLESEAIGSTKNRMLDYIAVGMGMNIFNKPDLATCLNDVARGPVYINKVRDGFLSKLSYYYELWQEKGFAPILELWLKSAHGLNQPITARLPKSEIKGVFKSVDEDGALVLELPDGSLKIIHAGEVYFGEAI